MNYDTGPLPKTTIDEMGAFPLTFKKDGCAFRYELLKMAYGVSAKPSSVYDLIQKSKLLMDWVNNEPEIIIKNEV